MKIGFRLIILVILFFSCKKSETVLDSKARNDAPQIVELDTLSGYLFNPLIGDTISPILTTQGDTLISGNAIFTTGKLIQADSINLPIQQIIQKPETKNILYDNTKIISPIHTIPLIKDSLTITKLGEGENTFLINSLGDTIPTGKKIKANPIIKKAIHLEPIRAGDLKFKDQGNLTIEYLSTDQGLPSSFIYCGLQDRFGNYWFGTYGAGLCKYDGESIIHYSKTEGLSADYIRNMVEDKKGNIWMATEGGGLCKFDGNNFTHYTDVCGMSTNILYNLFIDPNDNIWIATNRGASFFDGQNFIHYTKKEGLNSTTIYSVCQSKNGTVWFGNNLAGVSAYDGEKFIHYNTNSGLISPTGWSIFEDSKNNMWFGTSDGGLSKFDGKQFENFSTENGLANNIVLSIYEDKDNKIWITTWGGISIYEQDETNGTATFTNIGTEEGLSANTVWFTIEDYSGNFWFGTEGGGLSIYKPNSFKNQVEIYGEENKSVWTFMKDKQGELWFSAFGSGLIHENYNALKSENFQYFSGSNNPALNLVLCMEEDADGTIWLGTWGYGLIKYSPKEPNTLIQFTKREGLSLDYIFDLTIDKEGEIWLATAGNGVTRIQPMETNYRFYQYDDSFGLGKNKLRTVMTDKAGNIWFGTDGAGVSKITKLKSDQVKIVNYTTKEGLPHNHVRVLYEDEKGTIWIGTNGGGLCAFDGSQFTYYTEKEGLSSNFIRSITASKNGDLWIGTAMGLNLISPIKKGGYNIITFQTEDGLKGNEFLLNSAIIDKDNKLRLGTDKGIVSLDLNKFESTDEPPEIQLTNVIIGQQYYDFKAGIEAENGIKFDSAAIWNNYPFGLELPYNINQITFEFVGSKSPAQHKVKYTYFLEGWDKNWSNATTDTKITYRNLSPANYSFYIKCTNESNKWSAPFQYSFTIHPPWWLTWWSYLLYALLFIFLIYRIYQFFLERRLKTEEAERLKEMDQIKTKFFTNISHEFRTPLTLIKGIVHQLKGDLKNPSKNEFDKEMEVLERNSNQLLTLVNQLLDLSKLDARKKQVTIEPVRVVPFIEQYIIGFTAAIEFKKLNLEWNDKNQDLIIDTDKIAFGQIIQNLLGNALKFTEKGTLKINVVENDSNEIQIIISDTGIGISEKELPFIFNRFYQVDDELSRKYEGTGIGLALTKELVDLLKGTISVESELNKGTVFTLCFKKSTKNPVDLIGKKPEKKTNKAPESTIKPPKNDLPLLLLVEDNQDVCYYISKLLENTYQILIANNGEDGLKKAIEKTPDFIISDWMMPIMTGPEMLQELKKQNATSHIPVMLLTARADQKSKLTGYEFGAEAYLTKPFEPKELELRIKSLIDARNNIRQQFTANGQTKSPEIPKTRETLFIEKTIASIHQKIEDVNLGGDWLAEQHFLSRSQFARKLRAITNKSVTALIHEERLKIAKKHLSAGILTISEVAFSVGFADPSYFTRIFTNTEGISPTEYKEGNKN